MKIAVTARSHSPDAEVDPRFGRARFFGVFDTENGQWTIHGNEQNLQAAQGAGIQAAQTVCELGAQAVITGHCGPKAFATLEAAGIAVYTSSGGTLRGVVGDWMSGALKQASSANVESHFGSV